MRIFYTFTCWIFMALLAFAQQPPEPPVVAPIAPLPPIPPLPPVAPLPNFAELPLLAFQDSQRDTDRNARRQQEQLRRLQNSSSEGYSRGKSYLLARLVTIGDRTVKIRGKSGIPEMDLANAKWHPHKTSQNKASQSVSTGGAR